jgi:hypothetical protein
MRVITVSDCGDARSNGEVQRKRAAAIRLAVDSHEATVPAHSVVDDGQAQAATLWAAVKTAVDAIELPEDLLLFAA